MSKTIKILSFSSLVLGLLIFSLLIFAYSLTQPVNSAVAPMTKFVIPKGQSISQIGQRLKEANLIKSDLAFKVYVRYKSLQDKIQAGTFELSPSMSLEEVASQLTQGTNDLWVTIPEGMRREQIADSLASYELPAFDKQEFLSSTIGLEGRLYPDTYLLPKMSTAKKIVSILTTTFDSKVIKEFGQQIENSPHSLEEILTMASLVEREAKGYDQMQKVAGVLWKRLDLGMPLQVDASLQYIKGYDETFQKWWSTPLAQDKKLESVYNTYLVPGLPPHPIANPGAEAIKASLNPIDTGSLYYIHDQTGQIHFAQDLNQHNQNINQYLR